MARLDDADDALRLNDAWGAASRDALARVERVQAAVEAVRVEMWSPGREVRVTVDATGLLTDVHLSERALRASALSLGSIIVRTAAAARAEAGRRVEAAASDTLGADDDPLLRSVRGAARTLAEPRSSDSSPRWSSPTL